VANDHVLQKEGLRPMNDKKTTRFLTIMNSWAAFTLLVVIIAMALTALWAVHQADRQMRDDLLQQARLVKQAVNLNRVKALTGTEADLGKPDYRRLKEQLYLVRQANNKCRFIYLMGRMADGTVFLYVDSELADSKDYSPPGQVYGEAPKSYRRVFDTSTAAVEGPVTDRWGTWVSALVPMHDPATGKLIAVMGMDIDARMWRRDVAAHAALPLGLMLVLLILTASAIIITRSLAELRESESLQRLMFENIDAGIVIIDADTHIIERVNKKSIELLGSTEDQLVGRLCYNSFCPFEKGCCTVTDLGQDVNSSDDFLLMPDGSHLPVLRSVRHIRIKGKDKLLETFKDITKRKQAEEEERHSEKLSTALEMAGAICHELNQPLQVISGRIDILSMVSKDEQTLKILEIMKKQVYEIGTITKKLMGLKKYSNRDYAGTIKITDINQKSEDDDI
jgi:PAS domain S-box-containing protein